MVKTIPANDRSLHEVETHLKLQENTNLNFFREWWQDLPELSDAEAGIYRVP